MGKMGVRDSPPHPALDARTPSEHLGDRPKGSSCEVRRRDCGVRVDGREEGPEYVLLAKRELAHEPIELVGGVILKESAAERADDVVDPLGRGGVERRRRPGDAQLWHATIGRDAAHDGSRLFLAGWDRWRCDGGCASRRNREVEQEACS